jgi:hypothetical protein
MVEDETLWRRWQASVGAAAPDWRRSESPRVLWVRGAWKPSTILKDLFSSFGEVVDVVTKVQEDCSFVRMATSEGYERALRESCLLRVLGQVIRCAPVGAEEPEDGRRALLEELARRMPPGLGSMVEGYSMHQLSLLANDADLWWKWWAIMRPDGDDEEDAIAEWGQRPSAPGAHPKWANGAGT